MAISLAHPLPGAAATGGFRWRPAFTENGVHVPAMLHNGQDYGADTGTPIRAAHPGKVLWSGWDPVGGGWGVQLGHDDGWSTLYFHMSHRSTDVSIGQRVSTGQTIGRVGMSGLATGPHLHFMLRIKGSDVDPVPYIKDTPKPSKPTTITPAIGQEEDEDMSRNVCVATKHEDTYRVRIFELTTGEEHQYTFAQEKYIENVAKTYGCTMVSYITNSHYAQIGKELADTRKRLAAA